MSDDPLVQFNEWANSYVQQLAPAQRQRLAMEIGKKLRRSQSDRIKAQQNPDGSAYEPRIPRKKRGKKGQIRRKGMFAKLATNRFLRVVANAESVSVGFTGSAAKVARIHQEGLTDTVGKNGAKTAYARRELLGFSKNDIDLIREELFKHMQQA